MTPHSPDSWDRLSPLLDEALELNPAERAAWLAEQHRRDPVLGAELDELLRRDGLLESERFLDPSTGPAPLGGGLAGTVLGNYRLERLLGQGGMGTVWLARRSDGRFEGEAAIKFLNLAVAGPVGEARFRREGSALARLSHPNIARLLDAGLGPAGQPYLVLERVDGVPLDDWCDERRLPVEGRIRLFRQVLEAVAHAHASLIVHRDLKPANILVTPEGRVKLLDFGIARILEEGDAGALRTGAGERMLTLEYASPEQVRGEPVSTATDIYSLGVVLYRLLSGQHPTSGGRSAPAEQLRSILDTDPAALSRAVTPGGAITAEQLAQMAVARDAQPERLRRTFAGDLDNILAKALRKEPEARYQTVRALADDLDRYLRHEPVSARPDSWRYRAAKFVRRNRGGVTSALLVTVALIGTTGMAAFQMRVAQRERDQARLSLRRQVAVGTLQEILAYDTRGPNGAELSAAERRELALTVLRRTYGREPWLVAEGMTLLASRYHESGDRAAERSLLAEVQRLTRDGNLPVQLAQADCDRVYSLAYDEVFDSAHADLAEAKRALARSADEAVGVVCLDAEGYLLMAEGRPDSAVRLLREAVERGQQENVLRQLQLSMQLQLLNDLAQALRGGGQVREAVRYHERILAVLDSSGYALTELTPHATGFLFSALSELGELARADAIVGGLIRQYEAVQGVGNAEHTLQMLYGTGKLRVGQLDSADLWIARVVRDSTTTGVVLGWVPAALGQLRLDQGRIQEARAQYHLLPSGTPSRRATRALLGARLRYAAGDRTGALRALEDSLRAQMAGAPPSPLLATSLLMVAEWRLATGDAGKADSLARLAISAAAVDSLALSRSGWVGRGELIRARALRLGNDALGAGLAAGRAVTALEAGFGPGSRYAAEAVALRDSLASAPSP